jgi:ubiquinone/menaquinone biosynthesis C-methylase UbiE/uncharacterized protein YbaR (Trm112 family)
MLLDDARNILACPVCKADLSITDSDKKAKCLSCGAIFAKEPLVWNFIPDVKDIASPIWKAWQAVQENGMTSYRADPDHNLSVGRRNDCRQFAEFCNFQGLVLDVGCGPQPWPAYFDSTKNASYVGIDPLAGATPSKYLTIKALAEYLPFRMASFDRVLFSTTLDHFVDSVVALKEAARVCKTSGEIIVWLGEKRPDAPKRSSSPEWYVQLRKPELAEDVFHIKRLNVAEFQGMAMKAGVKIVQTESHQIDEYRTNYFYRLKMKTD